MKRSIALLVVPALLANPAMAESLSPTLFNGHLLAGSARFQEEALQVSPAAARGYAIFARASTWTQRLATSLLATFREAIQGPHIMLILPVSNGRPAIEVLDPERLAKAHLEHLAMDFDGTLWLGYPERRMIQAATRWMKAFHPRSKWAHDDEMGRMIRKARGASWDERLDFIGSQGLRLPESERESLKTYVRREVNAEIEVGKATNPRRLTPGARDFLLSVQQAKIDLSIVTGGAAFRRHRWAEALGIGAFFPKGSIFGDGNKAESIRKILEKHNLEPHQVAMIGDADADIQAAAEAGVLAIGFARTAKDRDRLIKAGAQVIINRDLMDLNEILKTLRINSIGLEDFQLRSPVGGVAEAVSTKDLALDIKFGTAGWRGGMSLDDTDPTAEVTPGNVSRLAQAIATYAKEQESTLGRSARFVVGYDARYRGQELAKKVISVLAANGLQVAFNDQVAPTPVLAEATRPNQSEAEQYDFAIQLTASHNPYRKASGDQYWQGIKIFAGGVPASDALTGQIAKIANGDGKADYLTMDFGKIPAHQVQTVDLIARSNLRLANLFDFADIHRKLLALIQSDPKFRNFGVRIDSMYGGTVHAAKIFRRELGNDIILEHLNTSPMYEGAHPKTNGPNNSPWGPDPTNMANYDVLARRMQLGEFAILIDGDGDRAVIKDINGREMTPNELGLIFAHYLFSQGERGSIVRTLPTTRLLDRFARFIGSPLQKTGVGSKNFMPYLQDMLVAVEESGHIFFRKKGEVLVDSGIGEALLALEIIANTGMSLSEYLQKVKLDVGTMNYARVNWEVTPDEKDFKNRLKPLYETIRISKYTEFAEKVAEKLSKKIQHVENSDTGGVLVEFVGGTWAMYRVSGTEPIIRVYGEEIDQQSLKQQGEVVMEALSEMAALHLPKSGSSPVSRNLPSLLLGLLGLGYGLTIGVPSGRTEVLHHAATFPGELIHYPHWLFPYPAWVGIGVVVGAAILAAAGRKLFGQKSLISPSILASA